jgi:dethiobiotin synthetase
MSRGYFITGTDTDSGKTVVTLGLMQLLQDRGYRVAGMKPVAAGAEQTVQGWRNSDALQLQAQSTGLLDYATLNPYLFEPPIAPHLAARQAGIAIDFSRIRQCFDELADQVDWVVVEGAGGWRVPLGEEGAIAELAVSLELPVILVVGLKLGCINHALLSVESIVTSGANLIGWIGSQVDSEMRFVEGNVETLKERITAPCLGIVPHLEPSSVSTAYRFLQLP